MVLRLMILCMHVFDQLITFLQENPVWAQKLYIAKSKKAKSEEV